MKPIIILLLLVLIIAIALLVRHVILRTGGAFDSKGIYIVAENDIVIAEPIYDITPKLKVLIDAEIKKLDEMYVIQDRWWQGVKNYTSEYFVQYLPKTVDIIEQKNEPKLIYLILLLRTYININYGLNLCERMWDNLHWRILQKFDLQEEDVLVGKDNINIKNLKPEQLTQEICNDIVKKAQALPNRLERHYMDTDYVDQYEGFDDYYEEDPTIPIDELQKRLQEMLDQINNRKWALMFYDCKPQKAGSKTKAALRTINYDND